MPITVYNTYRFAHDYIDMNLHAYTQQNICHPLSFSHITTFQINFFSPHFAPACSGCLSFDYCDIILLLSLLPVLFRLLANAMEDLDVLHCHTFFELPHNFRRCVPFYCIWNACLILSLLFCGKRAVGGGCFDQEVYRFVQLYQSRANVLNLQNLHGKLVFPQFYCIEINGINCVHLVYKWYTI